MTFEELSNLVYAIECDERLSSVRFGCDCGCGGDAYTEDQWDDMVEEADQARIKLEDFGVVFDDV